MMYEIDVIVEGPLNIRPDTAAELDMMLEYNSDDIYVNKRHVKFSVDGDTVPRNESKDPYFKMFPDCTIALTRNVSRKLIVYRVFFKKPLYTSHETGGGTTPPKMGNADINLMLAAFQVIVKSKVNKGKEYFLWEELKLEAIKAMGATDLIVHELPKLDLKDKKTKEEIEEARMEYEEAIKAEKARIYEETKMYINIKYDKK